jgi:hypothetical protein
MELPPHPRQATEDPGMTGTLRIAQPAEAELVLAA